MRERIRVFLLGMREFRTAWTSHFDYPLAETYDKGRDLAHRLTFRYYDETWPRGNNGGTNEG